MTPTRNRIAIVDVARGGALVAMTIYHLAWDLETFGYLLPGTIAHPGWVLFARSIAASFLFLVGVSLVLAHGDGYRWRIFVKRTGMVVAAAALVSLSTRFTHPEAWIFFGILHAIALFSVLSLPMLRMPWWLSAGVAVAVLAIDAGFASDRFTGWLWWTGLHAAPPVSNDFVPVFPWWAATLAGVAAMQALRPTTVWRRISGWRLAVVVERPLLFIGRNSLLYYLLHQPLMIGALAGWVWLGGGPDPSAGFAHSCRLQCEATADASTCRAFCGCVTEGLAREGLLRPFAGGTLQTGDAARADALIRQCRDGLR